MNNYFKIGFEKIASPLLIDKTDNRSYDNNPYQEERQRILENAFAREQGRKEELPPEKAVKEESSRRPGNVEDSIRG